MEATLRSRRSIDKCTKPIAVEDLTRLTRYAQREHGGGINSWMYEYQNTSDISKTWMGCGLEIGVQLRGEWRHEEGRGARIVGPGGIDRISMGERYRIAYRSPFGRSLQVGFIVCEEELERLTGPDGELRFVGDRGVRDVALHALAEAYAEAMQRGDALRLDVAGGVRAYVRRHCELVAQSGLLRGKRELERFFACDLPMSHLAAIADMHPDTFTRHFKEGYGLSPAAYRIALRINYASRLCWKRPHLSIADIANECGFRSMSYFHRAFVGAFGMTPARARARFLDA